MAEEPAPQKAANFTAEQAIEEALHPGGRKEKGFAKLVRGFKDLAGATRSPDRETRRMAYFFLLSSAGVAVAIIVTAVHVKRIVSSIRILQRDNSQAENINKLVEKEKAATDARLTVFRLGTFGVALKDIPGSKPLPGVVNMAELEIVLQCDTRETCDYIEANHVQARDVATAVLVPQDRDDLMSSDGKERLKTAIVEKLNGWLPKGQVKKVYFSRLLLD